MLPPTTQGWQEDTSVHWWTARRGLGLALLALLSLPAVLGGSTPAHAAPLNIPINHVIVIYQENWSFDSLYGKFPGANGLANAGTKVNQVDRAGNPMLVTPQPWDGNAKPPAFDTRFPANL